MEKGIRSVKRVYDTIQVRGNEGYANSRGKEDRRGERSQR